MLVSIHPSRAPCETGFSGFRSAEDLVFRRLFIAVYFILFATLIVWEPKEGIDAGYEHKDPLQQLQTFIILLWPELSGNHEATLFGLTV